MSEFSIYEVLAFLVIVAVSLFTDLIAHREDKPVPMKNAVCWSLWWIALALLFGVYIYSEHGSTDASLYLTGYVLEKALSVDNLFVIMAVFSSFHIPEKYQHRVLYYGILGAVVLRFIFIALGAGFIEFGGDTALAIFGFFILWSAFKMWQESRKEHIEEVDYTKHFAVKWTSKILPVYPHINNHDFFVKVSGKYLVTPLFLSLIVVEFADLMFAIDSVPAVFAVTEKPFLVYTSNIFAILGLRSLFFVLSAMKKYLCHLEKAVIAVLVFIGLKMILEIFDLFHFTEDKAVGALVSLAVVLGLLAVGVVASLIMPKKSEQA